MRWGGRSGSGNIEDRRGMRMGLPIGGGIGGLILVLLFSALTGQNPADLLTSSSPDEGPVATSGDVDDPEYRFLSNVLGSTEETWTRIFSERGTTYQPPVLVLFSGATQSACGVGQAAMGPFYCPADRKLYLDTSFFRELAERFGAPGDFAQAYVIAHEVGHHVQTITGARAPSVEFELQADCYAGVWGHFAAREGILEPGDAEEGLRAAAAIGDDRLQQMSQGRVVPESFTHGSSEQRVRWLRRGMEAGRPEACDAARDAG
jgi:predicted metalloprotease